MSQYLVESNILQHISVLKSLANPKRLQISCALFGGEKTVGQIQDILNNANGEFLSQSSLSQHLARMRDDGVVAYRRDSRHIYYELKNNAVRNILMCLQDICQADSLASMMVGVDSRGHKMDHKSDKMCIAA